MKTIRVLFCALAFCLRTGVCEAAGFPPEPDFTWTNRIFTTNFLTFPIVGYDLDTVRSLRMFRSSSNDLENAPHFELFRDGNVFVSVPRQKLDSKEAARRIQFSKSFYFHIEQKPYVSLKIQKFLDYQNTLEVEGVATAALDLGVVERRRALTDDYSYGVAMKFTLSSSTNGEPRLLIEREGRKSVSSSVPNYEDLTVLTEQEAKAVVKLLRGAPGSEWYRWRLGQPE